MWTEVGQQHQSLNDTVANALRKAIFRGDFKPGERLTEPGLAKLFGVSRNPIREALRKLQSEGIVEIPPRKSARVALLSRQEVEEIIELRAELEGLSARFATRRLTDETRKSFQKLLDEGNEAAKNNDIDKIRELNSEFHGLLASSGKNRYLADFMRMLRERTLWLFNQVMQDRGIDSWYEHAAVLEAVMSSDEKLAGLLAARHVRKVGTDILTATGEEDSPEENDTA
ncbi:GntR family transcriptional regulator [Luteithermobacter gelatinilyticus]|uniref:GntR family transcriptional regulator n=1 Tax=Luteithermobacter gelatinilyticus TaxID=2582913 RepID=UPI001105BD15|nr:GntR family transcriptional regulator [Luteithermobacter gelatinilyticus]|tara:strand:+ start:1769 stop:2452 length:684 start_codon:yes stop_codon:yes gene_type:complete